MNAAPRSWMATLLAALAWGPLVPCAAAQVAPADSVSEPAATFEWSTSYASRYAFQGIDYSDGRPVLQPSVSASRFGFTAGLWGTADQTQRRLDEFDATVQRDLEHGRWSGALGYEYLRFPNRDGWSPTHEGYLDLAFDAAGSPSLSMHWDVAAGAGRYWTLGAVREFPAPGGTLGAGIKLNAQEHYYGMTGIPSVETRVSFAIPCAGLALVPSISRIWTWSNGDFRAEQAIAPGWLASVDLSPR